MKQRLLVMNGQRLLQTERDGEWQVSKVDKAGLIKPGIYNFSAAVIADKAKTYDGVVLHADGEFVFQQVGRMMVKHEVRNFDKVPAAGNNIAVRYNGGLGLVVQSSGASPELGRGVRR